MGKRKEYRKIIKNYKEQKIVFQEEMKLDYSKLEETIAEAIKIEKERENENKRKHKLTLKTTINFRFCLLIVQVNEMIFMSSLCVSSNSKSSKTTFFARIL